MGQGWSSQATTVYPQAGCYAEQLAGVAGPSLDNVAAAWGLLGTMFSQYVKGQLYLWTQRQVEME